MDHLYARLETFSSSLPHLIPHIHQERNLILARTNHLRNSTLPVARLPFELLTHVFEFLFTSSSEDDVRKGPRRAFSLCASQIECTRYNIMATCRQWRLVVKSMERVWRMVIAGKPEDPPLSAILRQLRTLPLIRGLVSAVDEASDPELHAAISLAVPKFEYLCYKATGLPDAPLISHSKQSPVAMPHLKKLSYMHESKPSLAAILDLTLASALHTLRVETRSPLIIHPPTSCRLRNLSLSGQILPSNVISILSSTPNLEKLVLTLGCVVAPESIIRLPSLLHLSLCHLGLFTSHQASSATIGVSKTGKSTI